MKTGFAAYKPDLRFSVENIKFKEETAGMAGRCKKGQNHMTGRNLLTCLCKTPQWKS